MKSVTMYHVLQEPQHNEGVAFFSVEQAAAFWKSNYESTGKPFWVRIIATIMSDVQDLTEMYK